MQYQAPINKISLLLLSAFACFNDTIGEDIKVSELCSTGSNQAIHLACETHQYIHVISIRYQEMSVDCTPLDDPCHVLLQSRVDGFTTVCNGRSSCWDMTQAYWITETCDDVSFFMVTISYECIPDSDVIDVCKPITALSDGTMLYIASSNYYDPTSINPDKPCACDISGEDMVIEILELFFRQINDVRANLTITSGSVIWTSETHRPIDYNTIILQDTHMVNIVFEASGVYGQILWIRVAGSSQIKVVCNGSTDEIRSLSSEHPERTVSSSSSMAGPAEEQTSISTLIIVSVTCGVVIFLLLVIIVSLLLYIKLLHISRKSRNYSVNYRDAIDVSYIHNTHAGVTDHNSTVYAVAQDDDHQMSPPVYVGGDRQHSHQEMYSETVRPYTGETGCDISVMGDNYTHLSSRAYQRD